MEKTSYESSLAEETSNRKKIVSQGVPLGLGPEPRYRVRVRARFNGDVAQIVSAR